MKPASFRLDVEKIPSGDSGLKRRQIFISSSSAALSGAINQEVPDSGKGIYVAAFWGGKPSCGYSVAIKSAGRMRNQVATGLALRNPPPNAVVHAAFTQPYAIAVIKDLNPRGPKFTFEDQRGRKLDWPVRRVSG